MSRRQFRHQQSQRLSRNSKLRGFSKPRPPFWLPALSFYVLSFAIAIAVFFLIWATLHDGNQEMPFFVAGISSSIVLGAAVILREFVLRRAQQRYLRFERQLDYNLEGFPLSSNADLNAYKVSVKRNAYLIDQLGRKSDAAKVLGHLPDGHWDVFELCNEYLSMNDAQLQTVGVGSPRLAALRRGKEVVDKLHKYHLLNWVEIETRQLTEEANRQLELSDKIELTQRAIMAIDLALDYYPDEEKFLESKVALDEFISSVKISHWIELAEREVFKKNYRQAVSFYRDSLFFLARENVHHVEKKLIAETINAEIERIRALVDKKPQNPIISRNISSSEDYKDD